jgi:hypothetical protein
LRREDGPPDNTMMTARQLLARNRRRAGQVAMRVMLGPICGTAPRTALRSLAGRSWEQKVAAHLEDVSVASDAHVERYDLGQDLPDSFRTTKGFDVRHLYVLREVCVSPSSGLVWLPGGPILEESVGSLSRLMGHERWIMEGPLLPVGPTVAGTVVICPVASYFHWVLECLPRLLQALAAAPEATLVVPPRMPRYAEEAIELLGIANVQRAEGPFVAERLVLVPREPQLGFIRRCDLELVRAALIPRIGTPGPGQEPIYVSRRLARRSPVNEAELEQVAVRRGLRVVYAEKMSFAEQIECFARAPLILGPHGAGLTNLVFAEQLEELLELFVVDHFNDCYARLAALMGARYRPFSCTGPDLARSVAPLETIAATLGG